MPSRAASRAASRGADPAETCPAVLTDEEYVGHDATGLAELVRAGEVTAAELVEVAIRRIERLDPGLNAVITPMFDEARSVAEGPVADGPFRGVPFLLKDLNQPYAGVPISQGCRALRDVRPEHDSELVRRFKASGVVTVGKTNTPEFGLKGVTEPEAFGPTRNPWGPERTPGGSSGGSGAAVAAGMVPMASGGDGGGSIRIPSAYCGLFGLKPSRGRTPLGPAYGEIWQGAVVDHVLTRSVRDSARMLDWISGPDVGAPYVIAPPARPFAEAVGSRLRSLRIGYTTTSFMGGPVAPDCVAAVERAARLAEELGHHVEEARPEIDGDTLADCYLVMYFGETAAVLDEVAGVLGRRLTRRDVELTTWVLAAMGRTYSAAEFVAAKRRWNGFARTMGRFHQRFDLLLTPTTAQPPARIGELDPTPFETLTLRALCALRIAGPVLRRSGVLETIARVNLDRTPFTQLANLTGQPAMSVPVHRSAEGLPFGAQFMAGFGEEATLLGLAGQLEEAHPWSDALPAVVAPRHAERTDARPKPGVG